MGMCRAFSIIRGKWWDLWDFYLKTDPVLSFFLVLQTLIEPSQLHKNQSHYIHCSWNKIWFLFLISDTVHDLVAIHLLNLGPGHSFIFHCTQTSPPSALQAQSTDFSVYASALHAARFYAWLLPFCSWRW